MRQSGILFLVVILLSSARCGGKTTSEHDSDAGLTNYEVSSGNSPSNSTIGPDGDQCGCYDQNGQCQSGTSTDNCGIGGNACMVCENDQQCTDGECRDVTPDGRNDAGECNGCLGATSGNCYSGNNPDDSRHCGLGGGICTDCTATNQSCSETGQCSGDGIFDSSNDASECHGCLGARSRNCYSGNDPEDSRHCGLGGEICTDCTATNQTCNSSGECSGDGGMPEIDDAGECDGCLGARSGNCYSGNDSEDSRHCGLSGEICTDCTATNQTCNSSGECQ